MRKLAITSFTREGAIGWKLPKRIWRKTNSELLLFKSSGCYSST
jgi:hypothetical protein